jgi:hypothetical protein
MEFQCEKCAEHAAWILTENKSFQLEAYNAILYAIDIYYFPLRYFYLTQVSRNACVSVSFPLFNKFMPRQPTDVFETSYGQQCGRP